MAHLYRPAERHHGPFVLLVTDEGSQATRWSTLGAVAAVSRSGRCVLVGDQDQLGPVYQTDVTNNTGACTLMEDMFARLPANA